MFVYVIMAIILLFLEHCAKKKTTSLRIREKVSFGS